MLSINHKKVIYVFKVTLMLKRILNSTIDKNLHNKRHNVMKSVTCKNGNVDIGI